MLTTVLRTAILMAAMPIGCLQAGILDDTCALEAGKTGRSAPMTDSLSLSESGAATTANRNVQNTSPVWYSLSDDRKMKVQDWEAVLFMQLTCPYCRQFAPAPKTFSQKTGLDVLLISLDGKGDTESPDVFPATPDVTMEYFQSGLSVATPITFLINANTMEAWLLLQGVAEVGEFRSWLSEVLRMTLDRQSGRNTPLDAQGQQ